MGAIECMELVSDLSFLRALLKSLHTRPRSRRDWLVRGGQRARTLNTDRPSPGGLRQDIGIAARGVNAYTCAHAVPVPIPCPLFSFEE